MNDRVMAIHLGVAIVIVMLVTVVAAHAGSFVSEVTSNEVVIAGPVVAPSAALPQRGVTNTVGELASLDGTRYTPVICVGGGTSGAAIPVWTPRVDISDATTTWRPLPRRPRKSLIICNKEAQDTIHVDFTPDIAAGVAISGGGNQVFVRDVEDIQGKVYCRSEGVATNTVAIIENW